jgi:putative MFS transporter
VGKADAEGVSGSEDAGSRAILSALDHSPLTRRHRLFLAALLAALVFDYLKPYTLAFVIPGVRALWGLSPADAAYLPVAGLTGTAVGALFWGVVADRIGRRTTLLWTVGIFTAAACVA